VGSESAWLASLVGPAGADGADGADGDAGADGADGASAYAVAVANGFVGSEAAWLASLVGAAGADGEPGADGADGATRIARSVLVPDPEASERLVLFYTDPALTLTRISAVLPGATDTPSLTFELRYGADASGTGTAVVTAGTTVTSTSTGAQVTSFDNASIPSGSWVWLQTTALSGTVPVLHVSLEFS
jgi:hypothetical protein